MRLELDEKTRLVVLTGAGVSTASGIAAYRGATSDPSLNPLMAVSSIDVYRRDPALVWERYSEARRRLQMLEPNASHAAIARVEEQLGDRFLLVTQNIDGLHARAGSRRMIEIHGNISRTRCRGCDRPTFDDVQSYESPPICDQCGEMLRPAVVWFGEMLDANHLQQIDEFMTPRAGERLVFVAAGTSGTVEPAASLVRAAKEAGGETWLVNLELAENRRWFDHVLIGKSEELLPTLLG